MSSAAVASEARRSHQPSVPRDVDPATPRPSTPPKSPTPAPAPKSPAASTPAPSEKQTQSQTQTDADRRSVSVEPSAAASATKAPSPSPVPEPAPEPSEEPVDEGGASTIDMETFHQILDLDEDETHDFSKGMAWAYFSQAGTTFTEMDEAFEQKDLGRLSSLGHFLKGSSAALGVSRVQASCEKIQHYGQLRDEQVGKDLTQVEALEKIKALLVRVKAEYAVAEKWLRNWYAENATEEDDA